MVHLLDWVLAHSWTGQITPLFFQSLVKNLSLPAWLASFSLHAGVGVRSNNTDDENRMVMRVKIVTDIVNHNSLLSFLTHGISELETRHCSDCFLPDQFSGADFVKVLGYGIILLGASVVYVNRVPK